MLKITEDPEALAVVSDYVKAVGAKLPQSLADLMVIDVAGETIKVLVPYWFPIVEYGRGPRKSNEDSGLVDKIYKWMAARNMFKSKTEKGKDNEAKRLTWYINHHGTKQFKKHIYKDIYETETEQVKKRLEENFRSKLLEVARGLIKLD